MTADRIYRSRIYRCPRPLGWIYGQISRQIMGNGDLPCLWCDNLTQVSSFSLPPESILIFGL